MPQDYGKILSKFGNKDLSQLNRPQRIFEKVTGYLVKQQEDEAIRDALQRVRRARASVSGLPFMQPYDATGELEAFETLSTQGGERGRGLISPIAATRPRQDITMTDAELAGYAGVEQSKGIQDGPATRGYNLLQKPEYIYQPTGKTEEVGARMFEVLEEINRTTGKPTGYKKRGNEVSPFASAGVGDRQEEAEVRKMLDQLDLVESSIKQYETSYGVDTLNDWKGKLKEESPNILSIAADPSLDDQQRSQQLVAALGQVTDPVQRNKLSIVSNYLTAQAKREGLRNSLKRRGKLPKQPPKPEEPKPEEPKPATGKKKIEGF